MRIISIKKPHINKFVKLANELELLMKEIQKYCPEANYYVTNDSLHLMKGQTHDDTFRHLALQENSVGSVLIQSLGGGDW